MPPDVLTGPGGFAVAVLALLAAPGPTNALLATAGASVGLRAALHLLVAEVAGYLLALGCLMLAVAPLLAAHPAAIEVAKAAAATYLVFLALRLWRRPAAPDAGARAAPAVRFGDVFIATLLNPKALILAFAIFPPVEDRGILWPFAVLVFGILTTGAAWIGIGATAKSSARAFVTERRVARASAVVLAAFAAAYAASATARLFA